MVRLAVAAVAAAAAVAGLAARAAGHGLVITPRQRGALVTVYGPTIDPTAPKDTWYVCQTSCWEGEGGAGVNGRSGR